MLARHGFTLTEVLIATSILCGALAGSAFLLTSAFGTYRHQNGSMEVFHVTHDKMEVLSGTPYDKLKQWMTTARLPNDPIRDALSPDQDFIKSADGDVTAAYKMVPQQGPDFSVYKLEPKRDGELHFVTQKKPPGEIDATLRLQYWDPAFDAPSMTDRGLIRATLMLKGEQLNDKATKYLAR